MARVTVTIPQFEGNKFIRRQIASIRNLSERQIKAMAEETAKVIKQKITESIKRDGSTGKLADSMFSLKTSDGWGVGDINFLNKEARYWRWQNFGRAGTGRRIPPKSTGKFSTGDPAPQTSGGTARWTQPGQYFINPTKPIEPMNYIQKTVNELNSIVAGVVRRVRL